MIVVRTMQENTMRGSVVGNSNSPQHVTTKDSPVPINLARFGASNNEEQKQEASGAMGKERPSQI